MFLSLMFLVAGFASLVTGWVFYRRRQSRRPFLLRAPLRAVGLEEQVGQDADVYHHIVYEVAHGAHAGRRLVSELGHGRPPQLPDGIRYELIHPDEDKVFTGAALRLETIMIGVLVSAGLVAIAVAAYLFMVGQN